MMINIKGVFETDDRWPLRLTKLEEGESRAFDSTQGTYYVILQQASYYSNCKVRRCKRCTGC